MPTYAELAAEPWWNAEFEAPAHAAFNSRLRAKYGHTKSQTGSKGDNRHLRGRHRSRAWCLSSKYCTDRAYATTDPRDKAGNENWLRATDVGIQGTLLTAASKRLDAAVRAGRLPCVAEWFGTIDGRTVVGWYEGRSSSADTSHLWHLHVGLWTSYCDNAAQLQLLGDIITGEDMPLTSDDLKAIKQQMWHSDVDSGARTVSGGTALLGAYDTLARVEVKLDGLITAVGKLGAGNPDVATILAGVDERLAALRDQVEADTRDAVADLAEGGAAAVRADADSP